MGQTDSAACALPGATDVQEFDLIDCESKQIRTHLGTLTFQPLVSASSGVELGTSIGDYGKILPHVTLFWNTDARRHSRFKDLQMTELGIKDGAANSLRQVALVRICRMPRPATFVEAAACGGFNLPLSNHPSFACFRYGGGGGDSSVLLLSKVSSNGMICLHKRQSDAIWFSDNPNEEDDASAIANDWRALEAAEPTTLSLVHAAAQDRIDPGGTRPHYIPMYLFGTQLQGYSPIPCPLAPIGPIGLLALFAPPIPSPIGFFFFLYQNLLFACACRTVARYDLPDGYLVNTRQQFGF